MGINTFGERVTTKSGMHDSMIVIFRNKNFRESNMKYKDITPNGKVGELDDEDIKKIIENHQKDQQKNKPKSLFDDF